MKLLAELRRRKVFRVAGLYAVTAWLLVQVAETLLPIFGTPGWVLQVLVVLLALGFIPALVVAWVFELTPEGLRRETPDAAGAMPVDATARRMDMVIIVLLLAIGALAVWDRYQAVEAGAGPSAAPEPVATTAPEPAAPPATGRSIAVLPFESLSADPEQGYFADGLTEEILNALASVPGLQVTARTSSFYYKDKDLPVDEIGARLGVDHLLEGTVRRSGEQLRVSAQLVRASDGFRLWSQAYDRPYTDAFAVQADIATQVASALGILLDEALRARMAEAGEHDPQAFAEFARGFELYRAAHNEAPQVPTLIQANVHFDAATAAAPSLWAAHFHSSDLYAHILLNIAAGQDPGSMPAGEVAVAREQLQERLDLALSSAPNEAARDFIRITRQLFSDDWSGLGPLIRRAYGHREACGFHQWMHMGVVFGMAAEARAFFDQARACNAFDESNWLNAGRVALYAGDPATAIDVTGAALALPELAYARKRLHTARVAALLAAGRLEEAREEVLRGGLSGRDADELQSWLAAASSDAEALSALRDQRQGLDSRDSRQLELAAIAGDRAEANRMAAIIDARPAGPVLLANVTAFCLCGAPFDLEATPNFAARLAEAELPWPPPATIPWPLKAW